LGLLKAITIPIDKHFNKILKLLDLKEDICIIGFMLKNNRLYLVVFYGIYVIKNVSLIC